MSNVFANLLEDAARKFLNQTISFAQVRDDGGKIRVRLQAIEIMKQYEGDVTYGADPRGILFYDSLNSFAQSSVAFTYSRYSDTPSNFIAIQIGFKGRGEANEFARFVARVDTSKYSIPLYPSAGGNGRWRNFRIATTEALAFRPPNSPNVTIQFGPIGREVTFASNRTTEFSVNGIFMFKNFNELKDIPVKDDKRHMHVQPNRDLCVFGFAPGSGPAREFGIFLPNLPVDLNSNLQPPPVEWYDFEPDTQSFAADAVDTPDEEAELSTAAA